jgi:hypothetical protein
LLENATGERLSESRIDDEIRVFRLRCLGGAVLNICM